MPALEVKNLTKIFRLYRSPKDRLREILSLKTKKYHREFRALDEVSFAVERGETLGIIGQNGSGKSTLLKILCGVSRPTSGSVSVHGRIASLLELGAGFDPEFTGRENVYMNGALMGYSKDDMDRLFPEIETFADIGEFMEQPVKRYSSGMFVRLAFSTAISVEPDILLIDEALAVGDMNFQLKCIEKLKSFQQAGRTIVFVTHNSYFVRNFCTRALWLEQGRIKALGNIVTVTDAYSDFSAGVGLAQVDNEEAIKTDEVDILDVVIRDVQDRETQTVDFGDPFSVKVRYRLNQRYEGLVGGVAIFGREQVYVCGLNTKLDDVKLPSHPGTYDLTVQYLMSGLLPGTYNARVAFFDSSGIGRLAVKHSAASWIVRSIGYKAEGFYLLQHKWAVAEGPGNNSFGERI